MTTASPSVFGGGGGGLFEKDSDGFLEVSVDGVGVRAVSLPDEMAVGRGNHEVGITGRGEVDEFLPVRFVGIERHEVAKLLGGHAFAHAIKDHGADQGWGTLEESQTEIGDTGVGMVILGDFLAPDFAQFAALLRKAHDENQKLLAARTGENDLGIVQGLGFDGGDGLCRRQNNRDEEEQDEFQ